MRSGEVVPAFELVEWEVPREAPENWPETTAKPLTDFWGARIRRQKAIDTSIATKAQIRVPLRQAVRRHEESEGSGPVHRREPQSAPHARCGRERRSN